jgi:hypothetical protein
MDMLKKKQDPKILVFLLAYLMMTLVYAVLL